MAENGGEKIGRWLADESS